MFIIRNQRRALNHDFEDEAVELIGSGQLVATVALELGVNEHTGQVG